MVSEEDEATVTDFGIARPGAPDMTQTGPIMGTAQYLSPEQALRQLPAPLTNGEYSVTEDVVPGSTRFYRLTLP